MAAPSTPTGLAIDNIFSNGAIVSWNSSAGATYYELYLSEDDITYRKILEGDLTERFVPQDAETDVYFKVLAGNVDGESALSAAVSSTTLAKSSQKSFLTPKVLMPFDGNAYFAGTPVAGYNYGFYTSWRAYIGGDLQVDEDIVSDLTITAGEGFYLPSQVGNHFRIYEDATGFKIDYYNGSSWINIFFLKDGGVQEGVWNVSSSITKTAGGTATGGVSDVQTLLDGNLYQVVEAAATPGFDIKFNFTNVTHFRALAIRCHYSGLSSHDVVVQIYNYNTTTYDQFLYLGETDDFNYHYIEIPNGTNYVDGSGNAIVRLLHTNAGNPAHDLYIDFVALKG